MAHFEKSEVYVMKTVFNFLRCHLISVFVIGFILYGYIDRESLFNPESVQNPVFIEGGQHTPNLSLDDDGLGKRVPLTAKTLQKAGPDMALARQSYWNDEVDKAIGEYLSLSARFPRNADIFGELGNIYFQQGHLALAAKAYYDAALLLLEQGEIERASSLLEVLGRLKSKYRDPLADRLKR